MFKPLKSGLEAYLGGFYQALVADTKPLEEFVTRGFYQCFAWAPSRMVDKADEMLDLWQRHQTATAPTTQAPLPPSKLPVVIVGMARDHIPTGRDFTKQLAVSEYVVLPGDAKGRIFGLRTSAADIRCQLAIFAADIWTARSLAAQLLDFLDIPQNQRFMAAYTFASIASQWPVGIETPEVPAQSIESVSRNLAILAVDIMLKATVPLFDAPADSDPNDGRGTTGNPNDPSGYPSVQVVEPHWMIPREIP